MDRSRGKEMHLNAFLFPVDKKNFWFIKNSFYLDFPPQKIRLILPAFGWSHQNCFDGIAGKINRIFWGGKSTVFSSGSNSRPSFLMIASKTPGGKNLEKKNKWWAFSTYLDSILWESNLCEGDADRSASPVALLEFLQNSSSATPLFFFLPYSRPPFLFYFTLLFATSFKTSIGGVSCLKRNQRLHQRL